MVLDNPNTIQAFALRLLARREHSRAELKRKLLLKQFSDGLIESVLDELEKKDWQSDLRFAESYVRTRVERGDGILKIQMRLREKGVSEQVINQVVPVDDAFWQTQLARKWVKKQVSAKTEIKIRARNIRFLQSRGFTLEQIQQFIS